MSHFAIMLIVSLISFASAIPVHNGMVFYQMPYYNPYQQAMFMHYAQPMSRTGSATSAFALGDSIAAGSFLRENRVQNEVALAAEPQSDNDGNVEAIAEAYPEDSPAQDTVSYDSEQQREPNSNEVIPLNVAPVSENNEAVIIQEEPVAPTTLASPTTATTATTAAAATTVVPVAPKKKVHVTLDIPDASTSDDDEHDNVEDDYPVRPQKPNRPNKGQSPTYTYFPLSLGRAAGGTVAIANAYSTGKGGVRSHAIAYGTSNGLSRQQAAKRQISYRQ